MIRTERKRRFWNGRPVRSGIESRKEEIAGICRRCGAKRLGLHGSAAWGSASDPETGGSDCRVDFNRRLPDNMQRCVTDLEFDLAESLGRDVDFGCMGVIRSRLLQAHFDRSPERVCDCNS
ncbi:MAG: hypothetical protein F4186_04315 [Boseongicola sp. SB0676_bin_33]|nr:hypothetical protein [Boseongicola sp. SB0676_bin_33]